MEPQYITVTQLSERWAVSKNTLYKWVQGGKVPHTKLNGALRFSKEQIAAFEEQQRCAENPTYGNTKMENGISDGKKAGTLAESVQEARTKAAL